MSEVPLFTNDPGLAWLRAPSEPSLMSSWTLQEWDRVVRLARRHRLLARLARAVELHDLGEGVPEPVRPHLQSALNQSRARVRALRWAAVRVRRTLGELGCPLLLLKGAAYLAQGLPVAEGRLPSDLDILVPRPCLDVASVRLGEAGWSEAPLDPLDRQYYVDWSHELPPMHNGSLGVELDVHHGILPPRDGLLVDTEVLLKDRAPCNWPGWQVLSPADQVVHCAAHLFLDSEPGDRVRDLVDLHGLMIHFGRTPAFWDDLRQRAVELALVEPVVLACHFVARWIGPCAPDGWMQDLERIQPRASRPLVRLLMEQVLRPSEPDDFDTLTKRTCAVVVLARYHWHRLPARVLIPHLWRKWRMRRHDEHSSANTA